MDLKPLIDWVTNTPSIFKASPPIASKAPFSKPVQRKWTAYQGNQRLGFLYQHLCSELFKSTPTYSAIAEEIQLVHEGKTLGSVDFILKNRKTEQFEHWEVAVKFYLLHQGLWYGPNAEDRLDLKLSHMLNHQLPLSSSEQFSLKHPLWSNASQHLLMQGRLYINPFTPEPVPDECLGFSINDEQVQGRWCYQSQAHLIKEPLYLLDKAQWLTGRNEASQRYSEPQEGFVHCQSESGVFWFILPETWPSQEQTI